MSLYEKSKSEKSGPFDTFLQLSTLALGTIANSNFFVLAIAMEEVTDLEKSTQIAIYFVILCEAIRSFISNIYGIDFLSILWQNGYLGSDKLMGFFYSLSAYVQLIIIIVIWDDIMGDENCNNCNIDDIGDSCDIDDLSCQIETACQSPSGLSYFAQITYFFVMIESAIVILYSLVFVFFSFLKGGSQFTHDKIRYES
eukprot:TRINITY_DN3264_c0_g1_i1.p1 TRINITY_DN3264_c0_g1~~TRINITY_DN3264_c0_g1_i1.p1  ORF type:complete len:198 (+),score=18.08 TRINITY_DN3264_c0_g1_i1:47-640(+)